MKCTIIMYVRMKSVEYGVHIYTYIHARYFIFIIFFIKMLTAHFSKRSEDWLPVVHVRSTYPYKQKNTYKPEKANNINVHPYIGFPFPPPPPHVGSLIRNNVHTYKTHLTGTYFVKL